MHRRKQTSSSHSTVSFATLALPRFLMFVAVGTRLAEVSCAAPRQTQLVVTEMLCCSARELLVNLIHSTFSPTWFTSPMTVIIWWRIAGLKWELRALQRTLSGVPSAA